MIRKIEEFSNFVLTISNLVKIMDYDKKMQKVFVFLLKFLRYKLKSVKLQDIVCFLFEHFDVD